MRAGCVWTARKMRSITGSSIPASVMMPKYRIAKMNMPATGATFWMPCTMNVAVFRPKPATRAPITGTTISALSALMARRRISARSRAMVANPMIASIGKRLFEDGAFFGFADEPAGVLRKEKAFFHELRGRCANLLDVAFMSAIAFFERRARVAGSEALGFGAGERNVAAGE